MPSPLRYFRSDPNKNGRGAGVYYHRGKGVYSQYSTERDKKIKARGYSTDKIGQPRKSKKLHTTDGKIKYN